MLLKYDKIGCTKKLEKFKNGVSNAYTSWFQFSQTPLLQEIAKER